MIERVIEIEAASLEEARRKLYTDEWIVLEESILSEGKIKTIEAIADTVDEALSKAENKVPAMSKTESRKIRLEPKKLTLIVQAEDEESAGQGRAELIASVSLLKKGRKGFWGFGKTSNVYEVIVCQPAVVELTFRERARIQAKVRSYSAEGLLESIQDARQRNAQWTEIVKLLNPKSDPEIHAWLVKLHEFNPASALDVIENACRNNQKANWQLVIKEAHTQASTTRARELREQEIRLRDGIRKPDMVTPEKFPVIRDVMNRTERVRFKSSNGSKVTLRHTGTKTHPGPINVEIDGTTRGTIGTDGYFSELADQALDDFITSVLRDFNRNPGAALEHYGRETGECGVCGKTLTNPESIANGIGPICARKIREFGAEGLSS